MTCDEFKAQTDPAPFSQLLQAMWHDAHDNWSRAHELAQSEPGPTGAWIHAYLHRKEGDAGNARYWYARAGRPFFGGALEAEWSAITTALLSAH